MGHGPLTTLRGAKFFELVCRLNYLLTQQIWQEDFQERDFVILMGPGSIIAYPIMIMMLLNNNNVIHRPNLALKRLCFFSCFVHSCRKFRLGSIRKKFISSSYLRLGVQKPKILKHWYFGVSHASCLLLPT